MTLVEGLIQNVEGLAFRVWDSRFGIWVLNQAMLVRGLVQNIEVSGFEGRIPKPNTKPRI